MTKRTAKEKAQAIANKDGIEMIVYFDPIGLGEQEGFDDPWGYAPARSINIAAKHRVTKRDINISPEQ